MSKNKYSKVSELLKIIAYQIESNPKFISEIESFLRSYENREIKDVSTEPILDVWSIHTELGIEGLVQKLNELPIGQLVKIIQKNSFDQSKLSYKWKNKDKLVQLIHDRILDRTTKGNIFLNYGKDDINANEANELKKDELQE